MVSHHGTLWIVKNDMLAHPEHEEITGNRLVQIRKGEVIEWRFESDNHFRTRDDKWFWVDTATWDKHCLQIGKIIDDVCWKNKANTDEIWRLELFSWIQNGEEFYKNIQKEIEAGQITPPSAVLSDDKIA